MADRPAATGIGKQGSDGPLFPPRGNTAKINSRENKAE